MNTYNIAFPINDDNEMNKFFSMNSDTDGAYKSDLLLLLLTPKGERYYYPNYGCNLIKYIFEPNDNVTANDVEIEIKGVVAKYLPEISVSSVKFNWDVDDDGVSIKENQLSVNISFTYNSTGEEDNINLNF